MRCPEQGLPIGGLFHPQRLDLHPYIISMGEDFFQGYDIPIIHKTFIVFCVC